MDHVSHTTNEEGKLVSKCANCGAERTAILRRGLVRTMLIANWGKQHKDCKPPTES